MLLHPLASVFVSQRYSWEREPRNFMDPSQIERGPPKESFYHHSLSCRDAPLPPPPLVAPPHMMYYPPAGIGYHVPGHGGQPLPHYGFSPGYIAYPHEYPQPQQYNYHPTPVPYYSVPPTYQCHPTNANGKRFIRSFMFCSCLLFMGLLITTLVMALALHPVLPVYMIDSLSVANFNTTLSLTGEWNTSITIANPNDKLRGYFYDFKVEFVRKSGVVAVGYAPNFEMDKKEHKKLDVKASSNGISLQRWELDEMANERNTGNFTLAIRASSMVSFKTSSMSTRSIVVVAICNQLHLKFQNNTGTGMLDSGGQSASCKLYM